MIYRFARLTHALQTSWEIEQCAEHGNARASRAGLIPDHPRPLKGRSRCSAPPSLAPLRRSAARNAQPSHRFRRRAAARPGFRSPLCPPLYRTRARRLLGLASQVRSSPLRHPPKRLITPLLWPHPPSRRRSATAPEKPASPTPAYRACGCAGGLLW
jgi:hypothetical protein